VRIPPLSGDDAIAVTDINDSAYVVGNSANTQSFTGNNPLIYTNGATTQVPGIQDAIPYAIKTLARSSAGNKDSVDFSLAMEW
jgi:hypothetical protein